MTKKPVLRGEVGAWRITQLTSISLPSSVGYGKSCLGRRRKSDTLCPASTRSGSPEVPRPPDPPSRSTGWQPGDDERAPPGAPAALDLLTGFVDQASAAEPRPAQAWPSAPRLSAPSGWASTSFPPPPSSRPKEEMMHA